MTIVNVDAYFNLKFENVEVLAWGESSGGEVLHSGLCDDGLEEYINPLVLDAKDNEWLINRSEEEDPFLIQYLFLEYRFR